MTAFPNGFFFWRFGVLLLAFWIAANGVSASEKENALDIAVVVSLRIRPYVEAVEGLVAELEKAGASFQIFYLEDMPDPSPQVFESFFPPEKFTDFVAVGPESGRFLSQNWKANRPLFFMMILNPEDVLKPAGASCGVSLHIPVPVQTRRIAACLPEARTIGILFGSSHNSAFVSEASQSTSDIPLRILPLPVSTPRQIPQTLKASWDRLDALWLIPDRTVISERLVHFILKESLLQGIPVIGYNRFFYESGALLSFIIDYEAVGRKTAQRVLRHGGKKENCSPMAPPYQLWLNLRVRNRLGISTPEPGGGLVKAGP